MGKSLIITEKPSVAQEFAKVSRQLIMFLLLNGKIPVIFNLRGNTVFISVLPQTLSCS